MRAAGPVAAAILITVGIAACSGTPTGPTATPLAVEIAPPLTETSVPSGTVVPTSTLVPPTAAPTLTTIPSATPGPSSTPIPPTPTTGQPSATTTPQPKDPPALIKAANAAMATVHSYRGRGWFVFTFGTVTPNPTPLGAGEPNIIFEKSGTDSYIRFGQVETIRTSVADYSRSNPTAKWTKAPSTTRPPAIDFLNGLTSATGTALELYQGTLCQVVTADKPAVNGGTPDHYKVWIGAFDALVRRYEVRAAQSQVVYELADFNAPIAITAPAGAIDSPTIKVGQSATLDGYTVSANRWTDPLLPPSNVGKPKAGHRWVTIDLTLTNTGTQPVSYNAFDVHLIDNQATDHNPIFGIGSEVLNSGKIAVGGSVHGTVTFEIPDASTPVRIELRPFGEVAHLTINLSSS